MYGRSDYNYNQPINQSINQSSYQPSHHYYPPQPTPHQSTNQSINQQINQPINQSNSRYTQSHHHNQSQHHGLNQSINQPLNQPLNQSLNQSINQSSLSNPFVLPSYIAPHSHYQNDMMPSKEAQMLEAAHSLMTSSSKRGKHQAINQPINQSMHNSSKSKQHAAPITSPQPNRRSSKSAVKSPVKSKRKRAETSKSSKSSRKRKASYSSDSSEDQSSSDDSSSSNHSSDNDDEEQEEQPHYQSSQKNKSGYMQQQSHHQQSQQMAHRMDHKESDDDDDGGDSDTLANWSCPPYTEDLNSLHESFQALMNHWKPEQKRAFERRRREILKSQLKNNVNRPDVTFIALLRRAAKIHASLAPDKYKLERDLIVSLFASELPRQLTMTLFDLSAWTIQRIVTNTQDGENVSGFLDKWKSKIRAISTTNADGSVSVHYSSKTRNRTCKLTGRTMKEEKDIAQGYYTKPENVNKDIIAIYAEYLQDMTGGDKAKKAPLSRANFYQLAPDGKKRKAKPEVLRLDCENCHFPIRLRVEEEEIITKISKKKKVKRLKGAPLDNVVAGAQPTQPVIEAGKKDKDSDLYETVEVVELVDGPPKKRLKVEMLLRNGQIVVAAREQPMTQSIKGEQKKKRVRTLATPTGQSNPAIKQDLPATPIQYDQHGNPIYSKRGPGRPRKSTKADANLTQQMLSMLPFLPTPVSTLTEQEKQAMGQVNQEPVDPDRIKGFISQLHGNDYQP